MIDEITSAPRTEPQYSSLIWMSLGKAPETRRMTEASGKKPLRSNQYLLTTSFHGPGLSQGAVFALSCVLIVVFLVNAIIVIGVRRYLRYRAKRAEQNQDDGTSTPNTEEQLSFININHEYI
ncbi:unnamed protein product [Cyprideis torosa]|uniref:Uncharacterized protein n=1 Tax=Cyprideis torosa TaxID=163714 RepID=A0A7R8W2E9_9CRUS|nr:unnamed protein product [Cyprideis torosa]CAG0880924.1 unnamed protein product [Cyprideis torosa]